LNIIAAKPLKGELVMCRGNGGLSLLGIVCAAILAWGIGFTSARADTFTNFPAQGDYASSGIWGDAIASIQLTVSEAFKAYFASAAIPGYDSSTGIYNSGLLYDPGPVKIGASAVLAAASIVGGSSWDSWRSAL
jgi:hypothetical protein